MTGRIDASYAGARFRATNGTNTVWFGLNAAGDTWGLYDETNSKYLVQSDGSTIRLNGTANRVDKNLSIKLNGGATEGTNLFTFNGSTAKTINITPASINASPSDHIHAINEIVTGTSTWPDQFLEGNNAEELFMSVEENLNLVRSDLTSAINAIDWFNPGTSIPSNSDLNTYETPGKYYCGTTSTSETLVNCPVSSDNFALFVFSRTSSKGASLN
jgi:hypothetical protein